MSAEGDNDAVLVIIDHRGQAICAPRLHTALRDLVSTHLASVPHVALPVILKLKESGGADLDAYAMSSRCLRVSIPHAVLRGLESSDSARRAIWELRRHVIDLAQNFRSRAGAREQFFRAATRSHEQLVHAQRAAD